MLLFLDIETLPSADPDVAAELAKDIKAPANYKKPESIAEWMAIEGKAALAEKIKRTSFDGLYGRIACIAWAFDDGPVQATLATDSEQEALFRFYESIMAARLAIHGRSIEDPLTIVGHNVAGFDLPFLKHRSIILGIKPPASIYKAMQAKPWGAEVADTMLMWSSDREKRASMDKLCRALGIAGKDGFDGSMVAETWPTDPQKVISYCADDVERTRAIYKRLVFA